MEPVESIRVRGGFLAPSVTEQNTWFYYDDRGVEVKVQMTGKVMYYSHRIHPETQKSIREVVQPI